MKADPFLRLSSAHRPSGPIDFLDCKETGGVMRAFSSLVLLLMCFPGRSKHQDVTEVHQDATRESSAQAVTAIRGASSRERRSAGRFDWSQFRSDFWFTFAFCSTVGRLCLFSGQIQQWLGLYRRHLKTYARWTEVTSPHDPVWMSNRFLSSSLLPVPDNRCARSRPWRYSIYWVNEVTYWYKQSNNPLYVELGYLELPAISNRIGFPLDLPLFHPSLYSGLSRTPRYLELYYGWRNTGPQKAEKCAGAFTVTKATSQTDWTCRCECKGDSRNLTPTSLNRTPATSNYFSIPLRVRNSGVLLHARIFFAIVTLYMQYRVIINTVLH